MARDGSLAAEVDRIRGRLAGAGHPWTRPRSAVLRILVAALTPLTVDEIHASVAHRAPRSGVNLSSVYRTLHLLCALRVVRRVHLGDRAQRYELAEEYRGHHHHLLCERCGRIEDVRRCPVEGVNLGVAVRSHSLELSGLCAGCAARARTGHVGA